MKKQTISARVHIPLEAIESLLYSARKGTSYWVTEDPNPDSFRENREVSGIGLLEYENEVKDFIDGDLIVYVFDGEDNDKKYELDIKKIKKGLSVLAREAPNQFAAILNGDEDMYTADALVQCSLFGKIIYA